MGSILLSLKSGITYTLSSLTQSLSGLSRMLRATSLLQMLSYIPIHDIFERKKTQTSFVILWWKQGYYINVLYYVLAPILTAMKPFLPLTANYYRNGQLYFLFENSYSIFLGNVPFLKTLMIPWPFIYVRSWIRDISGGCSLVPWSIRLNLTFTKP